MVNTIVFWDNHVFFFSWIPTLGFDDSTFTIDYSLLPTSGSPIRNLQLYILRIHVVFYTLQLPISVVMYLSSFVGYHFFWSGFSFVFCSIATIYQSFAFGFYFICFLNLLPCNYDALKYAIENGKLEIPSKTLYLLILQINVTWLKMQSVFFEGNLIIYWESSCLKLRRS